MMSETYFSVINTGTRKNMMHDATRPYAVVEVRREGGGVIRTVSRHISYRGACVKCARVIKESN